MRLRSRRFAAIGVALIVAAAGFVLFAMRPSGPAPFRFLRAASYRSIDRGPSDDALIVSYYEFPTPITSMASKIDTELLHLGWRRQGPADWTSPDDESVVLSQGHVVKNGKGVPLQVDEATWSNATVALQRDKASPGARFLRTFHLR